jgi:ribose 1,5-bisphosphokinase
MTWLVDLKRFAAIAPGQIGPGRLILVVGPSGAGKDTLIEGARRACESDRTVVFPKRIITRPASAAEDNESVDEQTFNQTVADSQFALWWDAHDHRYGIPSSIDGDIAAGRTVICNVSRTIVGAARRRYAAVTVVLITAPPAVLERRLASRSRRTDSDLKARLARSANVAQDSDADIVIRNVGRPEVGIRRLVNAVRDTGLFIVS